MYKLISDYRIIGVRGARSNKASSVASEAMRLIKDGWTPLGSITSDNDGALYQVMLKYAPPANAHPHSSRRSGR